MTIKCASQIYLNNEMVNESEQSNRANMANLAQTFFVYPSTHYVAEVYDKHGRLVKNISLNQSLPFLTQTSTLAGKIA